MNGKEVGMSVLILVGMIGCIVAMIGIIELQWLRPARIARMDMLRRTYTNNGCGIRLIVITNEYNQESEGVMSEASQPKGDDMKVGTFVKVKDGASAWMRERDFWIHDWPESIDGMIGEITRDYTEYKGDDCHYEIALPGIDGCGVHPQWLIANGNPLVRLPRRVLNALEAASEALEDLGACDDPDCRDDNCNHALTKVRDVLAEQ